MTVNVNKIDWSKFYKIPNANKQNHELNQSNNWTRMYYK